MYNEITIKNKIEECLRVETEYTLKWNVNKLKISQR